MRRQRAIGMKMDEERIDQMEGVVASTTSRATVDNNAIPPGRRQRSSSPRCRHRRVVARLFVAIGLVFVYGRERANLMVDLVESSLPTRQGSISKTNRRAEMGRIIYGAKGKGEDTAGLVTSAILSGFRHIATGGFHSEYNESGVGVGWTDSGIPRHELYLQTLFVARSVDGYGAQNCDDRDARHHECPPPSNSTIEEQVHASIESSMRNLRSDYIDAVLVHNFRARLQPYDETVRAWRVLETYVDKGIVRHLGIVSVHDAEYLTRLYAETRIKPTIIQNRFHSNRGYDVGLRPLFREWGMANQLFWILTGSAGGRVRNNGVVRGIAKKMGDISPQVLLYSLTMELGGSPLIGSQNVSHMREDVDGLIRRRTDWEEADLVAMAAQIDNKLIQ